MLYCQLSYIDKVITLNYLPTDRQPENLIFNKWVLCKCYPYKYLHEDEYSYKIYTENEMLSDFRLEVLNHLVNEIKYYNDYLSIFINSIVKYNRNSINKI